MRQQKGLSQENRTDELGLSTTAYGDIERGRTEPPLSRLEAIARLLRVPLLTRLGLETTSLSETEWLNRDNEALRVENARLY